MQHAARIIPAAEWRIIMKKHRILTVALAAAMALGSLYGCGTKESSQQAVTPLKMILVGEKPAIYDEIYGKLNEMLRQDIGAELNIEYYNYSDLKQKYSLLFSSGEDFDIVFSADWVQYNQQAAKNSFMEITDDMLKKNAPKTYEQMTDKIKNEVTKVISENAKQNESLINLGYHVYERNLKDTMYEVDNIDNFYYGPDGAIYLIFAYGNNNFTSELDIVPIV